MKFAVASASALLLAFPSLAQEVRRLTETDTAIIEATVRGMVGHPEKAIFLTLYTGVAADRFTSTITVCGRVRLTDDSGSYLGDFSEFIGVLDRADGNFLVESLAVSAIEERLAVTSRCNSLLGTIAG